MNFLKYSFCYLAGPMDRAPDSGINWRQEITPFLTGLGVIVLDPINKPIVGYNETLEFQQHKRNLKAEGKFSELASHKMIRHIDLRMVDKADFIIANINMDHKPFGTIEEITTANRQKKPILIWAYHGIKELPDWLFWKVPHRYFFESLTDIKSYLLDINNNGIKDNRWIFFNIEDQLWCIINRSK